MPGLKNLPLKSLYDFCGFKPNLSFVSREAIHIDLDKTTDTGQCPSCNKKQRWTEQIYERCIRDLDIAGKHCYLHFVQYKIRCPCSYRGIERLSFVDKYSRYSVAFEEYVAKLCEVMSIKEVSEIAGIDWRAIKQIDKKYLAKNKVGLEYTTPKKIGVDEVAHQKGHKYLTIVRDVDEHKVIWIGEKRKKEVKNECLFSLRND